MQKMTENTKRIVEIEGVKVEVDLRTAKTVENYKVGDAVKVLVKSYGDSYTSHPGVIAGFDEFKNLPTLVIAYLEGAYEPVLKFTYLNKASTNIEICPMTQVEMFFNKASATDYFDAGIQKKKEELADLERKRIFFLGNFDKYFEEVSTPEIKEENAG